MAYLNVNIPSHCYTCELQKIDVDATGCDTVTMVVSIRSFVGSNPGLTEIFRSVYRVYNSAVSICDIGSLLETFMQNMAGVQCFHFAFFSSDASVETESWVFSLRNRTPVITAGSMVDDNFLTCNHNRVIRSVKAKEQLPFLVTATGSTTIPAQWYMFVQHVNGNYERFTASEPVALVPGVRYLNCSLGYLLSGVFFGRIPGTSQVRMYSVTLGMRQAFFYVMPHEKVRTFAYRNPFGCIEYISVPTAENLRTETQKGTASCGDDIIPYDIAHTRTYEEQTPVLMRDEMGRLEELFTSPQVFLVTTDNFGAVTEHPVIIDKYEFKNTDGVGEGNSAKFEWRFASQRFPVLDNTAGVVFDGYERLCNDLMQLNHSDSAIEESNEQTGR